MTINYMVTSNTELEIQKSWCPACEKELFELVDHEVERCVHCNHEFNGEPEYEHLDGKYRLIIDPLTGTPSILVRKEVNLFIPLEVEKP